MPRLAEEVTRRSGVGISVSWLSTVMRKKGGLRWKRPRHTLKSRQDMDEVERSGLRLQLMRQQAESGDITLIFADESEALTHPYLSHMWAPIGAELRIEAPGQSHKRAILGARDAATGAMSVITSATKRSSDFVHLLELLDTRYGPGLHGNGRSFSSSTMVPSTPARPSTPPLLSSTNSVSAPSAPTY